MSLAGSRYPSATLCDLFGIAVDRRVGVFQVCVGHFELLPGRDIKREGAEQRTQPKG